MAAFVKGLFVALVGSHPLFMLSTCPNCFSMFLCNFSANDSSCLTYFLLFSVQFLSLLLTTSVCYNWLISPATIFAHILSVSSLSNILASGRILGELSLYTVTF